MSRRKTVQLNLDVVGRIIKEKCRSNAVFCEKMDRAPYWVTDWHRKDEFGNPTPKNLPSPEEAAKMCEILQVEPEDFLVNQADIDQVKAIIGEKEKPTQEGELDMDAVERLFDAMTEKELDEFIVKATLAKVRKYEKSGGSNG